MKEAEKFVRQWKDICWCMMVFAWGHTSIREYLRGLMGQWWLFVEVQNSADQKLERIYSERGKWECSKLIEISYLLIGVHNRSSSSSKSRNSNSSSPISITGGIKVTRSSYTWIESLTISELERSRLTFSVQDWKSFWIAVIACNSSVSSNSVQAFRGVWSMGRRVEISVW